jgi:hypothetical protein
LTSNVRLACGTMLVPLTVAGAAVEKPRLVPSKPVPVKLLRAIASEEPAVPVLVRMRWPAPSSDAVTWEVLVAALIAVSTSLSRKVPPVPVPVPNVTVVPLMSKLEAVATIPAPVVGIVLAAVSVALVAGVSLRLMVESALVAAADALVAKVPVRSIGVIALVPVATALVGPLVPSRLLAVAPLMAVLEMLDLDD